MLVTALQPVMSYQKAADIAEDACDATGWTLGEAALK